MDISLIKKIINVTEKLPGAYISFTGGEFLTRTDWKDIITYANNKNIEYKILTNGLLLSKKTVDFLNKKKNTRIQISLDSINDKGNVLRFNSKTKQLLNKINYILDNSTINLTVKVTITRINQMDCIDTIEFLSKKGCYVALGYLVPMGRGIDNPYTLSTDEIITFHEKIIKYKKETDINFRLPPLGIYNMCPILDKEKPLEIRIKPNGDIFACNGIEINDFLLGNVSVTDLNQIIKGDKYYQLTQFLYNRYQKMKTGKCCKCIAVDFCRGGCIGNSYYEEGSFFDPPRRLCDVADYINKATYIRMKKGGKNGNK